MIVGQACEGKYFKCLIVTVLKSHCLMGTSSQHSHPPSRPPQRPLEMRTYNTTVYHCIVNMSKTHFFSSALKRWSLNHLRLLSTSSLWTLSAARSLASS